MTAIIVAVAMALASGPARPAADPAARAAGHLGVAVVIRVTGIIDPPDMPKQTVTAPSGVYAAVRQVDTDMAWADSLAGLPLAEAHATGKWVAYDLEDWSVSGADRVHPLASLKQFGIRAHADGFKVIMTPGYHFAAFGSDSLSTFYRVVRMAAKYGDTVDLQLERYDCAPSIFASAARHAVGVARAVNPGVPVVVNQVTPNPGCSVKPAWVAAEPYVSGRWVWQT
jgi:hypothetical protein